MFSHNVQMEFIFGSETSARVIVLGALLLTSTLIISFFHLLTGSWILGILLYLGMIWWLLRTVGSLVMYPGSSFVSRSDIEMRMSKEVGSRIVAFVNTSVALAEAISKRKYKHHQNHFDFGVIIGRHMTGIIDMLELFQVSLSQRKVRLLAAYRQCRRVFQQQDEVGSIEQFCQRPHLINSIPEDQIPVFKRRFKQMEGCLKEILVILKSYTPPEQTIDYYKFRIYGQRLYQIRFAFHSWKQLYNYDLNLVHTPDKQAIETAVIYNELQAQPFARIQDKIITDNNTRKCVLFCNPNGVFLQFFGADNEYIKNYLRLGFHVILWNYRGYGQSTGTPSIATCQKDAKTVYDYYLRKGFEIKIVHGYSIGGAAAIGLMEQLGDRKQDHRSDVEVLIVDRSFSSIGEMSIQFGDLLHRLTKLIFFTDNMDLSKHFEAVACRKLLIWDYCDEVIPDRASVKNCIIKRRKQNSKECNDKGWESSQLASDVQTDSLQQATEVLEFEITAARLAQNLRLLLAPTRPASSTDLDFVDSETHQTELSTSLSEGGNGDNKLLLNLIARVDGGGIQLLQNSDELLKIMSEKPSYFQHICESYVLGIVCYGSYFPLKPIVHDHQQIKEDTLLKLREIKKGVKEGYRLQDQSLGYVEDAKKSQELARNIYWIYDRLQQLVGQYYNEEWFCRHGSLLPTNNGHNAALNSHEYHTLNEFLRHTLAQHTQHAPQTQMTEESML